MPNMSYCRFENTLHDLIDCYENWDDDLSESEEHARNRMINICRNILDDYEKNTTDDE